MPDIETLSFPLLVATFIGGSIVVWFAGSRVSTCASEIARRTGLGQAVIGVVLLGLVTSLPEVATT